MTAGLLDALLHLVGLFFKCLQMYHRMQAGHIGGCGFQHNPLHPPCVAHVLQRR